MKKRDTRRERYQVIQEVVKGMLRADPKLASIARDAEQRGVPPKAIRDGLGRAFLAGVWHTHHEGAVADPNDWLANRFITELARIRA